MSFSEMVDGRKLLATERMEAISNTEFIALYEEMKDYDGKTVSDLANSSVNQVKINKLADIIQEHFRNDMKGELFLIQLALFSPHQ